MTVELSIEGQELQKNTAVAELVGLSGDVMAARKPSTEALKLAQEQYWFCFDIVEQGVGTIENLASGLMKANIWYVWWD